MVVSNVSGVALMTSSLFLLVVAISLNSPHLFYMSTAMIATLAAARIQAYYSVRNLTIRRIAPPEMQANEWAQIDLVVETNQKMRRPLLTLWDHLPPRLANDSISPTTPVAPAKNGPVVSSYRFRPNRRGLYKWSKVSVVGSDALGLVSLVKEYSANVSEVLVFPEPIPVQFDATSASGWGSSETEHGLSRGAGIEPRGTREYVYGDSVRHVHWRSTARKGQLVVKEFESGSNASIAFYIQSSPGSEVGVSPLTSIELICGHLAHIASRVIRQGIRVQFPATEADTGSISPVEREREILRILAAVDPSGRSLASDLRSSLGNVSSGSTVFVCLTVVDSDLPIAIREIRRKGCSVVCMLYDADSFDGGRKDRSASACSPAFVDELRASGASIRVMPIDGLRMLE